jgi:hypothetical protein
MSDPALTSSSTSLEQYRAHGVMDVTLPEPKRPEDLPKPRRSSIGNVHAREAYLLHIERLLEKAERTIKHQQQALEFCRVHHHVGK